VRHKVRSHARVQQHVGLERVGIELVVCARVLVRLLLLL
jgi:hypothetical protein